MWDFFYSFIDILRLHQTFFFKLLQHWFSFVVYKSRLDRLQSLYNEKKRKDETIIMHYIPSYCLIAQKVTNISDDILLRNNKRRFPDIDNILIIEPVKNNWRF